MKYKALALSFLLLLPLVLVATRVSTASFPGPPTFPSLGPVLWVDGNATYYGPCLKSQTFKIDVRVWNDITYTNSDVYAFEFNLTWTSTLNPPYPLPKLVEADVHNLFANTFLVANDTGASATMGFYHLAETAYNQAGLNTIANVSVLTLTFHVESDVFWPYVQEIDFNFAWCKFVSDGTAVVPLPSPGHPGPEQDNGEVFLQSVQPNIDLRSPDGVLINYTTIANPAGQPAYMVTERAIGVKHTIEVHMTNITGVYDFNITINYDPRYKIVDIQSVTIGPAFPPPYSLLEVNLNNVTGTLNVFVEKPSEKSPVCGSDVLAFSFVIIETAPEAVTVGMLNHPFNSTITVAYADYSVKSIDTTPVYTWDYYYPGAILLSTIIVNFWNPKLADLNLDGTVNIQDLEALMAYFGDGPGQGGPPALPASPNWGDLADPVGTSDVVDIYDMVFVAKHWGDP